jgi:excinuclease ABC subunit A
MLPLVSEVPKFYCGGAGQILGEIELPKSLDDTMVRVRGARENNLKNVDVDVPRDKLVVFSGISGSGKSSLAFGTLYAEAQRRYFESVSPYARRLIDQVGVPDVDSIEGLPPAIALQQQRSSGGARSSVGSITTISNLLRMLYSRAGVYPRGQAMLYAEDFSPNTPQGACPHCHGIGRIYDVTEKAMVPNDALSIRERAIAAWPPAWHGQNLRDILVTLGYDVDRPWRELPKKDRDWILYTEEQPTVPVYAGFTPAETRRALKRKMEPSYQGTFTGVRKYVLQTFATTHSPLMKRRVARYLTGAVCPICHGKRLRPEALTVKFARLDISQMAALSLQKLADVLRAGVDVHSKDEKQVVAHRICTAIIERVTTLCALGLGYLSLDRNAPTLSPGELQRLRLGTQIRSNLFGVIYVLDEPSAGLHPVDEEALLAALARLRDTGNSVFVVEHDLETMRRADWIVDVGPDAGTGGGHIIYSGPPEGLRHVAASKTAQYLFASARIARPRRTPRTPRGWLTLEKITINNVHGLNVRVPIGVLTAVTGVSGSGKSSVVSHALMELVGSCLGHETEASEQMSGVEGELESVIPGLVAGHIAGGLQGLKRLVCVDQKPIGRTPRSNLATYTGLFDHVRQLFATTPAAKSRRYDAGRFSFNVSKGRCPHCEGEGFVSIELLFMPSVYAPCPVCRGSRYNEKTLEIEYRGKNIAQVLDMTVSEAADLFPGEPAIVRVLNLLQQLGLGYLRLGQPATELSGGEAQRIKLATELQRSQRGDALYILDEPTTGLHAADVDKLMEQLNVLVDAQNTVVIVEHDLRVIAASDWVIDMGPGAGEVGGRIVAEGSPADVASNKASRTGEFLARHG